MYLQQFWPQGHLSLQVCLDGQREKDELLSWKKFLEALSAAGTDRIVARWGDMGTNGKVYMSHAVECSLNDTVPQYK